MSAVSRAEIWLEIRDPAASTTSFPASTWNANELNFPEQGLVSTLVLYVAIRRSYILLLESRRQILTTIHDLGL